MLYLCLQWGILTAYDFVGTISPLEPASKRSKVVTQPEKVIPTKHYLEPSVEQPGLFLLAI